MRWTAWAARPGANRAAWRTRWSRRVLGSVLAAAVVAAAAAPAAVAGTSPSAAAPTARAAGAEGAPIANPAAVSGVEQVIGGFESADEGWHLGLGAEFPGAKGSFDFDGTDHQEGLRSGVLTGDFAGGGNYVDISRAVDLDATALHLWARSTDLSGIVLRVFDSTGQAHQQRLKLTADGSWQQLTAARFDGGDNYSHFGGADDGTWHGPATKVALILDKGLLTGGQKTGIVHLDGVTMTVTPPDLAFEQTQPGNIFVGTQPARTSVRTKGDVVGWSVYDLDGTQVGQGRADVTDGAADLTLPLTTPGYYRLTVTANLDGAVLATRDTTMARLTAFDVGAVADSPFGMAAHLSGTENLGVADLMGKAGAKNLREDAFWSSIETTKGSYEFGRYDPLVSAVDKAGMRWLPIAAYINPFYDNNATPYTDEGRAGFARYAAATTAHYDDRVKWLEVYNEFNIGFGDAGDGPADSLPQSYFPLLKATYEQVKARTPDVTVAGAVTAGVPLDWLEAVFKLGGLRYMDVVSVHPYVYPSEPEQAARSLEDLDALIRRYNGGKPKPIWITEQGWPTHDAGNGVSEQTQAAYVVRAHVVAFAHGVQRYFWYDVMNDGLDPAYNEHNFGLLHNTADPAGRWTPKPGYVSYAAMTRQLTGARYVRSEDVGGGVSSYVFDGADGPLRVLWSSTPSVVDVITDHPVAVTDLTGATRTYHPQAGRVQLSLSGDPLYVAGDVKIALTSRYGLTSDHDGQAVLGDPIPLTLTVDTTKPPRAAVRGTFEIAGTSVPVSVPAGTKATIPVRVPAASLAGPRVLIGEVVVRGQPVARLQTRVDVVHPFQLKFAHVLRGGEDVLSVRVTNRADRDLPVSRLAWTIGDRSGTLDLASPVPAHATRTAELPLGDLARGQTYPLQLRLSSPGLTDAVTAGRLVLPPADQLRTLVEKPVTVDGTLDDLSGVPPIDLARDGVVQIPNYGGADDLSGSVWWTWDAGHLYLSAKVHDDVQAQPETGERIWAGDGFQFSVAAGMPGESARWDEYGVALTPAGPRMWRWLAAQGQPGEVTGVDVAVARDEAKKETTYEVALPWSSLAPLQPDDRLVSLSFLVNDNDGAGREGWIEWGSGIGGEKNSALFRPIRLGDG
ncbi:sugar-binding protein [Actinopolymorpha sp. NPDC004070]|uniref:sugar-binding protein n=1 Tax=Actinopolymorpha sp. NPDC004070 TaxID=3154548 RepID=UPI0033A62F8D